MEPPKAEQAPPAPAPPIAIALQEPKEEEEVPKVTLLQAIAEIEGIKGGEELQAIEAILKGEDHKVNADNTLLMDLPISEPAASDLDKDIYEQIIFDLDVGTLASPHINERTRRSRTSTQIHSKQCAPIKTYLTKPATPQPTASGSHKHYNPTKDTPTNHHPSATSNDV